MTIHAYDRKVLANSVGNIHICDSVESVYVIAFFLPLQENTTLTRNTNLFGWFQMKSMCGMMWNMMESNFVLLEVQMVHTRYIGVCECHVSNIHVVVLKCIAFHARTVVRQSLHSYKPIASCQRTQQWGRYAVLIEATVIHKWWRWTTPNIQWPVVLKVTNLALQTPLLLF